MVRWRVARGGSVCGRVGEGEFPQRGGVISPLRDPATAEKSFIEQNNGFAAAPHQHSHAEIETNTEPISASDGAYLHGTAQQNRGKSPYRRYFRRKTRREPCAAKQPRRSSSASPLELRIGWVPQACGARPESAGRVDFWSPQACLCPVWRRGDRSLSLRADGKKRLGSGMGQLTHAHQHWKRAV